MFCVVRAVHIFDSRLVINETPNKWQRNVTHALNKNYILLAAVVASVGGGGLYPHSACRLHALV